MRSRSKYHREDFHLAELEEFLKNENIPLDQWGQKNTNTPAQLLHEIAEQECRLLRKETGELVRQLLIGVTEVVYTDPDGATFILREELQLYFDGREKIRNRSTISEKVKAGESIIEGMQRGLRQELGICIEVELAEVDEFHEYIYSKSYPGLLTEYIGKRFRLVLSEEYFDPRGYVEEQEDKTVYFVWDRVEGPVECLY